MDLQDLLTTATSTEEPAGQQRVAALTDTIRTGDSPDTAALETAAVAEFERLFNDGDYNPDDLDSMNALADIADAVRTVAGEQAAQRQQQNEQARSLADRVRPTATDSGPEQDASGESETGADTPGGDGDEDSPGSQGGVESPAAEPPEAAGDTPPADTTTPPGDPDTGGEPVADAGDTTPQAAPSAEPELVPASAAPVPARRPATTAAINHARNTAVPDTPQPPKTLRSYSITASAEVPNTPYGAKLTMAELADAAAARFATFPVGEPTNGPLKANVARINRHHDDSILLKGDNSDAALLDTVADEKRLPGGSVVAAAQKAITAAAQAPSTIQDVWCTPSETDYTLCPPLATTDGMLDLPTTGLPARGGIRYPKWQQYPEQDGWNGIVVPYPSPNPNCSPDPQNPTGGLADPNYFRAPGEGGNPPAGAGYPKKCIEGPCVEWCEVRASLAYLCIISDILRDRTFPEGIQRFMSDVMIHHQHHLNETYIQHLVANADPIPAFSVQNGPGQIGSSSLTVVDRLALLVTWMRNTYKMPEGATLEIVAPEWFREYLKRDLEKKQNRPFGAVSNAEIASLFAQYTSRVQWVRDWQDMGNGQAVGGRVMPPGDWPSNVNILAYPAGSWVLSEGNILTLGVQYDHQLLQQNKYSAMFSEDSWMLVNRCNRTFLLQLTDLCANGAVGPERDACPEGTVPTVESIAVTGADSVAIGATTDLTAQAKMSDGSSKNVTSTATWLSSDTGVATVDAGTVAGVAQGSTDITANAGGFTSAAHAMTVPAPAQQQASSKKSSP